MEGIWKTRHQTHGSSYQVAIKPVAPASRLCRRRLKPAATINGSLNATRYQKAM